MQHVALSEFDIAIFVICLIGMGGGDLFVLPVSFKGYNMKVLISLRSCWRDAIGCALGLSSDALSQGYTFHSRDECVFRQIVPISSQSTCLRRRVSLSDALLLL